MKTIFKTSSGAFYEVNHDKQTIVRRPAGDVPVDAYINVTLDNDWQEQKYVSVTPIVLGRPVYITLDRQERPLRQTTPVVQIM